MLVTLYYIDGISRTDTPYFATKTTQASLSKQEEFFSKHIVQTVELSYYPPHYQNTIRFDSDDLVLGDNVNYLSLEYQGKTYYYFIDGITYISESIIELDISMDVIQTYMFDIYISNGIIERKFIKRYLTIGGNYILNRNYLRENVSTNEYVFNDYSMYNFDPTKWFVVIQKIQIGNTKDSNTKIYFDNDVPGIDKEYFLPNGNVYLIAPFTAAKVTTKWYYEEDGGNAGVYPWNSGQVSERNIGAESNLAFYARNNVIVDAYICPFDFIDGVTMSWSEETQINAVTIDDTKLFGLHHFSQIGNEQFDNFILVASGFNPGGGSHYFRDYAIKNKVKTGYYSFNFERNSTLNKSFDSKYITQLLDENYIRYTFGSLANMTTFPLFKLRDAKVYYHYTFNPSDGSRLYWLNESATTGGDPYNTAIVDTNILHLDLKNDPWQQYVAANRGRWAAAVATTAVQIFGKVAAGAVANKFAAMDIKDTYSNPSNFDRRYKQPTLKKKPSQFVASKERDIDITKAQTKVGAALSGKNIIDQAIQDFNVNRQPTTPKQMATVASIPSKEAIIMSYVEKVVDYEQCAQYYHRNGFLVNEYINHKDDIFAYVFNRYYFNILKMQLPNVHLHHIIEDEDTCNAIKDRLTDGVRLWNVNNAGVSIGDFQYDNVELDFLS